VDPFFKITSRFIATCVIRSTATGSLPAGIRWAAMESVDLALSTESLVGFALRDFINVEPFMAGTGV
jgi:hypothetical protein